MDNHTPPHNSEFEKSYLVSRILFNEESYLSPDDFYDSRHREIDIAISDLQQENKPVTAATITERLIATGNLEKAGGGAFISRILDGPPAPDPPYYAEIIKGHATRRGLIKYGNAIMKLGHNQQIEPMEAVDKAQAFILGIDCGRNGQDAFALKDLVLDAGDRLEALQKSGGGVTGVPSGYVDLDKMLCGFQNSDLIILAARPSMGKTALAGNLSLNAAKRRGGVGFFSLEMSKEQMTNRLMADESGVNLLRFQSGKLSKNDWIAITAAQEKLFKLPTIWIDDTPALSYGDLRRRARRMKNQHGIDILFVDYIQLMQGDKQNGRVEEVSSISRNLKATAKELNIPVVALSQLNRAVEMRDNKRPRLADLRDSGAIEQDADVVMFLYRDEYYHRESPHKGIADVIVAKQRNGPTGTIGLHWRATTTKFSNLAPKK